MGQDAAWPDATAQAELVRSGEASPAELVDAAIERIERLNPQLNAVITPLYEKARAAAKASIPDGPFAGVPFLVKDLTCTTAGDRYCEGTSFLKNIEYVAPEDSYLATKFRQAGFIFLGKTNTPEFGTMPTTEPEAFGASCNPWHLGRSTGGSSGGSAAAVAAGMVAVAHANDGGGSIRIPASECGLVGLKPSRGRTSQGPQHGEHLCGFVNELVVSRSVRDTAGVLDAVQGAMPGDPYVIPPPARPYKEEVGADPGALRIGVFTDASSFGATTHPDCLEAVEQTATLLRSLGHTVEETAPAALTEEDVAHHATNIWAVDTWMTVERWSQTLGRTIEPEELELGNRLFMQMGQGVSAAEHALSHEWLQGWTRRVAAWWSEGWDLLMTPTISQPPPPLGSWVGSEDDPAAGLRMSTQIVPFTQPWNITGQPAVSLPLHWNAEGLPIGVQFVAAYLREDLLLRLAAQLEAARPWADRRPPVSA